MKKRCFVIMGFGKKTDFQQQKTFDLDKTYRIIIKKAVEEAGLECIRADDVIHSAVIDKPMYELLLDADLVVADISTSNANAIYELGVRHALRPNTTIVIAEEGFKFPFDITHLTIITYQHLGEGIDAEVAEEVRQKIKTKIDTLINQDQVDSPVYTFLPNLEQPYLIEENQGNFIKDDHGNLVLDERGNVVLAHSKGKVIGNQVKVNYDLKVSTLMDEFQEARAESNFALAKEILQALLEIKPDDPYVIQQLALATYKSQQPDAISALKEAKDILQQNLKPKTSNDPETLGLWGAIHKRMWEIEENYSDLEEAIQAYEKGFYLRNDYYNGINFAFLLNVRASMSDKPQAIADVVFAKRIRRRVINILEPLLKTNTEDDEGKPDLEARFWLKATLVEALFGIGEIAKATSTQEETCQEAPEKWMADTMNEQISKLNQLISKTITKIEI